MSSSSSTSPFFLGSEDSASRAGEDVEPVDLQAYRKMLTGGSCTANTSTTTCPATSKPPPYACTLCGKIFHKLSTAKIHSLRHQDDAEDTTEGAEVLEMASSMSEGRILYIRTSLSMSVEDAKTRQRTCTLCGKLFFSQIVMALHTMSEPFFPSCHRCLETFDGADEKKAHLCKEVFSVNLRISGGLDHEDLVFSFVICKRPTGSFQYIPVPLDVILHSSLHRRPCTIT